MLIISAFNIVFGTATWYYIVIATVFCTALQFLLDGIVAIAINKMPDTWFGVDNPMYSVSPREREIYKKLKVKRWKNKVWEPKVGEQPTTGPRRDTPPTPRVRWVLGPVSPLGVSVSLKCRR